MSCGSVESDSGGVNDSEVQENDRAPDRAAIRGLGPDVLFTEILRISGVLFEGFSVRKASE